MVNVTPWQPSGAVDAIDTTSAMDSAADVAFAATVRLSPLALTTVTFADGHAPALLEVIAPGVIAVNSIGYGFGFVSVKRTSPAVNPGYRSAVPVTAVTVTAWAVNAFAFPPPEPFDDHRAITVPAASTDPTTPRIATFREFFMMRFLSTDHRMRRCAQEASTMGSPTRGDGLNESLIQRSKPLA